MQQKQTNQQKPQKHISLYSKFKTWCLYHRVPVILFPILAILVLAISALLIGGSIAGWDIVGFLTSPTGVLMYVILFLIIVVYIYYRFNNRGR